MVNKAKDLSWQTWALALFVTLTLSFGGYAWADAKSDLADVPNIRERVSVMESKTLTLEQQYLRDLQELKERMKRIEDKQDELLSTLRSSR